MNDRDRARRRTRHMRIVRHRALHNALDELLACFLGSNPAKRPSNTTVMEFLEWSHAKTLPSAPGCTHDTVLCDPMACNGCPNCAAPRKGGT